MILLLLLAAQETADDVRRVTIVVETTSDWTQVEFEGATVAVISRKLRPEDKKDLRVEGMRISKPSMDQTPVVLEAECAIAVTGRTARVVVTKGDIGSTRVRIADVFDRTNDSNVADDPANRTAFDLDLRALREKGAAMAIPARRHGKLALAFYYPWYGNPEGTSKRWSHWNLKTERHDSTNTPSLGWYDSHDPDVIAKHIEWAKSAGLDGFIVSWWGPGSFEDRAMPEILKQAERLDFKVSVYYEACRTTKQLQKELEGILDRHGKSPAFLRADGKPVIFIYGRVTGQFPPSQFKRVFEGVPGAFFVADGLDPSWLEAFDGLHTYNPATPDAAALIRQYRAAGLASRVRGKLFCATVYPGYDDTVIRKPGLRVERRDGELYRALWKAAEAADWVLVTSFNEWHEGSEIEPSKEHGDKYLKMTGELSREWKRRR